MTMTKMMVQNLSSRTTVESLNKRYALNGRRLGDRVPGVSFEKKRNG